MDVLVYPTIEGNWSISEAASLATGWLPLDSQLTTTAGEVEIYRISGVLMDYRQEYHSVGLGQALPDQAVYCGSEPGTFEPPGTLWIRLDPDGYDETLIDAIHVTAQAC